LQASSGTLGAGDETRSRLRLAVKRFAVRRVLCEN